jgi:TatD DNase family protein
MYRIFETHAHYDDEQFDEDREELLDRLKEEGIFKICNVGASMETSRNSVKLAEARDEFVAAVGIHPDEIEECDEAALAELEAMAQGEKTVAIGEIGLDYYGESCDHELQKKAFWSQLELAAKLDMPVIIHSREACEDTLEIMKEYTKLIEEKGNRSRGVIHCFSYSKEIAKEYLKLGYFIGIGGVITFKNARKVVEAIESVPMDRLVIETDCPYLAPVPFRGKRNDSGKLSYVVEKIAEIKGISPEEVADLTRINAMELYRLS